MNDLLTHATWYATRASGLVALVLLTGTVVLGMSTALRTPTRRVPRFVTQDLHRNISLLAVVFLGIHIGTTIADSFTPITVIDVVVPFGSAYRPVLIGLGAVAVDLVVALVVTSLLRQRLGPRVWRATHWLAYATWPVAVIHGLGMGTDARTPWVLVLTAACVASVFIVAADRIAELRRHSPRVAASATALGLLGTAILAGWAVAGPLAPRSAPAAGATVAAPVTPAIEPTARVPKPAARGHVDVPLAATLTGTLTRHPAGRGTTTRLDARLSHGAVGWLSVAFTGTRHSADPMTLRASGTVLGSLRHPAMYRGQVTRADSRRLVLLLHRHGADYRAVIRLSGTHAGRVHGRLVVRAAPPPPVRTVVVDDPSPPVIDAAPAPTAPTPDPTPPATRPTHEPNDDDGEHEDDHEHEHEHEDD